MLLVGFVVMLLAMSVWYAVAEWLVGFLKNHIAWLYEWALSDSLTAFISVLSGWFLTKIAVGINTLSVKIYPSRNAARFLMIGILSAVLTLLGAYCTVLGTIPFSVPVQPGRGILFSDTFALGVYAFKLISESVTLRKGSTRKGGIQTVCVFYFAEKKPNAQFRPFCYFTGNPGLLLPDGSFNENREKDQSYIESYGKMRSFALNAQNFPHDIAQYSFMGCLGFITDGRAYYTDRLTIDAVSGHDAYTNLFAAEQQRKNLVGEEMSHLADVKHYQFTESGTFVS